MFILVNSKYYFRLGSLGSCDWIYLPVRQLIQHRDQQRCSQGTHGWDYRQELHRLTADTPYFVYNKMCDSQLCEYCCIVLKRQRRLYIYLIRHLGLLRTLFIYYTRNRINSYESILIIRFFGESYYKIIYKKLFIRFFQESYKQVNLICKIIN